MPTMLWIVMRPGEWTASFPTAHTVAESRGRIGCAVAVPSTVLQSWPTSRTPINSLKCSARPQSGCLEVRMPREGGNGYATYCFARARSTELALWCLDSGAWWTRRHVRARLGKKPAIGILAPASAALLFFSLPSSALFSEGSDIQIPCPAEQSMRAKSHWIRTQPAGDKLGAEVVVPPRSWYRLTAFALSGLKAATRRIWILRCLLSSLRHADRLVFCIERAWCRAEEGEKAARGHHVWAHMGNVGHAGGGGDERGGSGRGGLGGIMVREMVRGNYLFERTQHNDEGRGCFCGRGASVRRARDAALIDGRLEENAAMSTIHDPHRLPPLWPYRCPCAVAVCWSRLRQPRRGFQIRSCGALFTEIRTVCSDPGRRSHPETWTAATLEPGSVLPRLPYEGRRKQRCWLPRCNSQQPSAAQQMASCRRAGRKHAPRATRGKATCIGQSEKASPGSRAVSQPCPVLRATASGVCSRDLAPRSWKRGSGGQGALLAGNHDVGRARPSGKRGGGRGRTPRLSFWGLVFHIAATDPG